MEPRLGASVDTNTLGESVAEAAAQAADSVIHNSAARADRLFIILSPAQSALPEAYPRRLVSPPRSAAPEVSARYPEFPAAWRCAPTARLRRCVRPDHRCGRRCPRAPPPVAAPPTG